MESLSKATDSNDWIRELEGPLTRYAASLGLNLHDAQDTVQDGLITLVRTMDKNPISINAPASRLKKSCRAVKSEFL